MARPKSTNPLAYKLHKPSGQARVRADGQEISLGKHGSPQSVAAYQNLVNEWLRNGNRQPENPRAAINVAPSPLAEHRIRHVFRWQRDGSSRTAGRSRMPTQIARKIKEYQQRQA